MVLVAYFSCGGGTRTVAQQIAGRLGADLYEIVPAEPYPADYEAAMQRAENELTANARPGIASELPDLSGYRTVLLGSPIWLVSAPRIMLTFLEQADLAGKTVLPFVTAASTGLSGVDWTYRKALPQATVADGLAIASQDVPTAGAQIDQWLQANELLPVGE